MRKLVIGLVLDDSLDKYDGVQQYVLILGRWFSEHGHEVHYLVGQTERTDLPNVHSMTRNVRVRFNGNRMGIPLPPSIKRIRKLIGQYHFDVLHVQMPYSPLLAGRIVRAASPTTAVVGTFHVLPNSRMVVAGNHLLSAALHAQGSLKRFDDLYATSPPTTEFAKRVYKVASKAIPLPLMLDQFLDAKPFPRYKKGKTVVYLGRLVERKGVGFLLKAVATAVADGTWPTDARVLICGAGPLRDELTAFVHARHLDKIVEFTGLFPEEDKAPYLASADIVVYPSTGGESFGIVLLEAFAASKGMVLAGNNPGYASVMAGHEDQLFDPYDTDTLARRLVKELGDDRSRIRAHEWQLAYVRNFDVSVVGQRLLTLYRRALRKRQG